MFMITQRILQICLIILVGFLVSCEDLENELAKDFTISTSNVMFNLNLTV